MGNKIRALSKKNKITDSEIEQSRYLVRLNSRQHSYYRLPENMSPDKRHALRSMSLALYDAIGLNDFETMKDLLEKVSEREPPNINGVKRRALMYSLSRRSNDEIVSYLIDIGGDINIKDIPKRTPLHYAARRDTSFITDKLLKRGAKICVRRITPLHYAITYGKEENFWCLLNFISANNLKFSFKTILSDAMHACSASVIEELIKRGADVNYPVSNWTTPLHVAIERTPEIVYLLLYYNASVSGYFTDASSVFNLALVYDETDQILPYLLEYVDDFDHGDEHGRLPLLQAILYNPKYISILIKEKGVNVNLLAPVPEYTYFYRNWRWPTVFCDFKLIWSHLNHKLLLENPGTQFSFLEEFILLCPNHIFLDCLYLIFESTHVEKFVAKYLEYNPNGIESLIYTFTGREIAPEERIEVLFLLLSYGVDIQFRDIYALYVRHGFDESLEVMLTTGCSINYDLCEQFCKCKSPPNRYSEIQKTLEEDCPSNKNYFMARQICYNNIDFDKHYGHRKRIRSVPLCYQHAKRVFCRNCLNYENRALYHAKYYMNDLHKIPSLLQMCRDLIRLIIYKKWFTPHAFKVYQAFLQLPVPSKIKDILFLKEPIYFQ